MPANNTDSVLLERILESAAQVAPEGLDESELFEYFTANEVLKDYDLSPDDLLAGITDGGGDGGVDSIYTFANEALVDEDFNYTALPRGYTLDLFIIQSKTEASFGEDALDKLIVSLPHLLNISTPMDTTLYYESVRERAEIFRKLFEDTASKFPKVKVHVIYATKGSTSGVHARVRTKMGELQQKIEATISGCSVDIRLEGARELRDMASRIPSVTLTLEFEGNYSKPSQHSYIALIPIKKYAEFLTDENGKLRRLIFESNVRDYQGTTQVNNAIRDSLQNGDASERPDFWWLNNGVTILCTQATINGDKFVLQDVQIVNGLQTSVAIYEHFAATPSAMDSRVLLARIITSSDEEVRNSIILATNRQNPLPPFAMRATDPWQKSIEMFFGSKGYFYDRRKNFYKNQGKPAALIVTIPYMAQATFSIGFAQPDAARARPSTLIVNEATYTKIFNDQQSLDGYLWMAKVQKKVDSYLRSAELDQTFKSNMRFHLSMLLAQNLLGERVYNPAQLQPFYTQDVNSYDFATSVTELQGYMEAYIQAHPESTLDKIAKSKDFTDFINSQKYPAP